MYPSLGDLDTRVSASPSGPHPSYGPDSAAHTKGVVSPEKKFPLWEIKFVNSVTGIPPG